MLGIYVMKRLSLIALLLAFSFSTLAWAQTDTFPDGLGEDQHPEGLRKIVESKDPRFVIVDVRPPAEYGLATYPQPSISPVV